MVRRILLLALVLATCVACDGAAEPLGPSRLHRAPAPPPDRSPPAGVVERYIARVRALSPSADIEVIDARHLRVDGLRVDLGNMGEECRRRPARCDAVIDTWARIASTREEDRPPPTREQVRAMLSPASAFERMRASFGHTRGEGARDPVTFPFVGPLVIVPVMDWPDTIEPIGARTRAALGDPTEDELYALALANMRAAFAAQLRTEPFGPAPRVRFVVTGDSYENSRVLLHERWAEVRRTVQGDLLVAAPARDVVIYTGSASEGDVAALRWLAQDTFAREPHPIAPTILRWTPERWELFHANDRPDPAIEATIRASSAAE